MTVNGAKTHLLLHSPQRLAVLYALPVNFYRSQSQVTAPVLSRVRVFAAISTSLDYQLFARLAILERVALPLLL